jgi:protein-S-isoprenylcysteine O-methyltransferase Ste14
MTESASTPRLRTTFAIYLALIPVTAFVGPEVVPASVYYAANALGFVCVVIACLGRIWCSLFIAGRKDETLVTTCPYAACRHPLYGLSILGALGLGLTSKSVLLCLVVVTLICALVVYAASCEEQFLADAFPEDFKAYVIATPNMWWPRLRPATTPDPEGLCADARNADARYRDVIPAVYWKAFLDAGSFFGLYLLVALAAEYRLLV